MFRVKMTQYFIKKRWFFGCWTLAEAVSRALHTDVLCNSSEVALAASHSSGFTLLQTTP